MALQIARSFLRIYTTDARYSQPPSGTLPTGFSRRPIGAILLAPPISFAPLSSLTTVLVPRSQPLSNRFNSTFFKLNILLKPEAFLMTKRKGVDLRGSRLSLIGSSDAEGSGDDDEGKGNGKKMMMSSAALGKYDIKKTKGNEFNKRRMVEKDNGVGDDDSILSLKRFDECNVSPLTIKALTLAGYVKMTKVQDAAISACLEGKDALVKAKTGTGKSAAFLKPINITMPQGEYGGLEHQVVRGVVENLKIIKPHASLRVAEYAFHYAKAHGRKRVSAIHKANIMQKTDGLFLKDWLSRATNWAKFSSTAGLGVIYGGYLQQGRSLMAHYLPQSGAGGGGGGRSPYSEGDALYALGLIQQRLDWLTTSFLI
ncbi:hypothetical protein Lser_V15G43747 [Lactuca serriola]